LAALEDEVAFIKCPNIVGYNPNLTSAKTNKHIAAILLNIEPGKAVRA